MKWRQRRPFWDWGILAFYSQQFNWKPWCLWSLAPTGLCCEALVQLSSSPIWYGNSLGWPKCKPNSNYWRIRNEHPQSLPTFFKTTLLLVIHVPVLNFSGTKRHLCASLGNLLPNLGHCKHNFKGVKETLIENNVVHALDFHLWLPVSVFSIFSWWEVTFYSPRFTGIVDNGGLSLFKDTWI